MDKLGNAIVDALSLSARRAWIEIRPSRASFPRWSVALRKESVDRNQRRQPAEGRTTAVALRKESVDRNAGTRTARCGWIPSLSARRAWIEILAQVVKMSKVASLSARRAWIEIRVRQRRRPAPQVALRKESVDRNAYQVR